VEGGADGDDDECIQITFLINRADSDCINSHVGLCEFLQNISNDNICREILHPYQSA
jgi:hypothetical protein